MPSGHAHKDWVPDLGPRQGTAKCELIDVGLYLGDPERIFPIVRHPAREGFPGAATEGLRQQYFDRRLRNDVAESDSEKIMHV